MPGARFHHLVKRDQMEAVHEMAAGQKIIRWDLECGNSGLVVAWCACVTCGGVVRHLLTDYDGPLRLPRASTLLCYRHTSSHPVPSQRAAQSSLSRPVQLNLKGTLNSSLFWLPSHRDLQSVRTLGYSVTEVLRRVKRCMERQVARRRPLAQMQAPARTDMRHLLEQRTSGM